MVELLVVLLIIAVSSGLVGLALRDGSAARLDREAVRLAALLEAARAESRASGVAVRFELAAAEDGDGAAFHFRGLVSNDRPPSRWLEPEVRAQIDGAAALLLGPEPLIGAQRVRLQLGDARRSVSTDGLAPFAVQDGGS